MYLIFHSKLLLSNETSAVHMAALTNTPTVSVTGGGHYGRFVPYSSPDSLGSLVTVQACHMDCFGCGWTCNQKHDFNSEYPCITAIKRSHVLESCINLLHLET